MSEPWQQLASGDNNSSVSYGRKQRTQPKKTPEKAHLDTFQRRERCQRSRAALLEKSEELGRLTNNPFILLSDTDEERTDADLSDNADNKTQVTKKNKRGKNMSKQGKHKVLTHRMMEPVIVMMDMIKGQHISRNS